MMEKDRPTRIKEYLEEVENSEELFTVAEYFHMLENRFGLPASRDREEYRDVGQALARICEDYENNRSQQKPNRYPEKCLAKMILDSN